MNDEFKSLLQGLLVIIAIAAFFVWLQWDSDKNTAELSRDVLIECQADLDAYQDALSEANDNISEANYMIEDAQGYAGGSYEEMNNALESLEMVDTIDEP